MDARFPDDETVTTAIAMAVRAPSIHNTQPWRWRLGYRSLHLYADPGRRLPGTDPDGRDLLLSCGAALHHLRVALGALGWRALVHRLPNPAETDHLAAIELRRHAPDTGAIALAAAAREHADDPAYRTELHIWSGRHGSRDGVPARNATAVERVPGIPALREFADPRLAQPPGSTATEDRAELLVLGTASDDRLSRLRAGEATSAALLTATTLGLVACPLTEPLENPRTRERIRDLVAKGTIPQMVLRIGWAPVNADPLPATPRRAVPDVCTALNQP